MLLGVVPLEVDLQSLLRDKVLLDMARLHSNFMDRNVTDCDVSCFRILCLDSLQRNGGEETHKYLVLFASGTI